MKKGLFIGLLFCTTLMYGQLSDVYSFVCDYNVNTGTGERKKWRYTLTFSCKFNHDKSICYEVYPNGKLKGTDINDEAYIHRFVRRDKNILIYKLDYVNSFNQHIERYMYFLDDFSKMNEPGGDANCVFSYDRVYPDKDGKPTQIW